LQIRVALLLPPTAELPLQRDSLHNIARNKVHGISPQIPKLKELAIAPIVDVAGSKLKAHKWMV
jgi:hypothetical protein